ncbi:MAG: TPM domain-containing protein [Erysipelotrichaceae bacterium]|nr:TPM domain-containing protein [Erysipelotrichaceae bacterium]
MKRFIKSFLIFLLSVSVMYLPVKASITVPDRTDPNGYVEDFAGVLSAETEQYINNLNYDLVSNYSGCVVVVTINYYQGTSIRDDALAIFNNWKIGDASTNDGVLFLMAIGDDDYYVMTGKGVAEENTLIPSALGEMFGEYTEDYFASGDYDNCAKSTAAELVHRLKDIYNAKHGNGGNGGGGGGNTNTASDIFMEILGLLFVILMIYLIIRLIVGVFRSIRPSPSYTTSNYRLNRNTPYYRRARRVYYRPPTYHSTWPSSGGSGTYHSGSSYHSSSSSHSSSSHSSSSYSSHSSSSYSRPSMPSGGSSRGSGSGRHG